MDGWIDLHVHTSASDGSMSPAAAVRYAKQKGLAAVAITDHDTVEGVAEGLAEAKNLGIEVIPGVEIGVEYKSEMHILGYFRESTYAGINKILLELKANREERNPKIIKKLNELGMRISMDEVKAAAGGQVVGRPHIARVMVDKGYVKSMEEAFARYLTHGRPAYFKKDKLTPQDGMGRILEAGGIPVLAHPIHLGLSLHALDELLGFLKSCGLGGIEAYYVDNTREDTGNLLRLAIKHALAVTGGSDFHGSFKPAIDIGVGHGNLHVPYEVLEKLKAELAAKK